MRVTAKAPIAPVSAVRMHVPSDADGNAVVGGDVRMFDCRDCMVYLPSVGMAVIEGLEGYVVAEKDGSLLVCRLSEEQKIKEYSAARDTDPKIRK